MRKRSSILAVILALVLTLLSLPAMPAYAYEDAKVNEVVQEAVKYIADTVKKPAIGSTGGEWAVIGLARSGYNLPQLLIPHVSCRENPSYRCSSILSCQNIPLIHIHNSLVCLAVGQNPHRDEDSLYFQPGLLSGFLIFKGQAFHLAVSPDFFHFSIPENLYIFLFKNRLLQASGSPQLVSSVYQIDFLTKPGQEDGILQSHISAAYHSRNLISEKCTVTGGTVRHPHSG